MTTRSASVPSRSQRLATTRQIRRTTPSRPERLSTRREQSVTVVPKGQIQIPQGRVISEALKPFINENLLDVEGALRAGVSIEDIEALGVTSKVVAETQVFIDAGELLGDSPDPLEFLSDPDADVQVLLDFGYSEESVSDWQAVLPFRDTETGEISLTEAVRSEIDPKVLERLFDSESISRSRVRIEAEERVGDSNPIQMLRQENGRETLEQLYSSETIDLWEQILPFTHPTTGEVLLLEAIQAGVPQEVLDDVLNPEAVEEAKAFLQASDIVGERDLVTALREGVQADTLVAIGHSRPRVEATQIILPYINEDGQIDLAQAIKDGISQNILELLFESDSIQQTRVLIGFQEVVGDRNLTEALQAGIPEEALLGVGFSQSSIDLSTLLLPFTNQEGQIDLTAALEGGVDPEVLRQIFDPNTVSNTVNFLEARSIVGDRTILQALRDGIGSQWIEAVGYSFNQIEGTRILLPYINEQGQVDLKTALEGGVSQSVFEVLGIDITPAADPQQPGGPSTVSADPRTDIINRLRDADSWSEINAALIRDWVTEAELIQIGYTRKDIGIARSAGMTPGTALWINTMSGYGWTPNELATLTSEAAFRRIEAETAQSTRQGELQAEADAAAQAGDWQTLIDLGVDPTVVTEIMRTIRRNREAELEFEASQAEFLVSQQDFETFQTAVVEAREKGFITETPEGKLQIDTIAAGQAGEWELLTTLGFTGPVVQKAIQQYESDVSRIQETQGSITIDDELFDTGGPAPTASAIAWAVLEGQGLLDYGTLGEDEEEGFTPSIVISPYPTSVEYQAYLDIGLDKAKVDQAIEGAKISQGRFVGGPDEPQVPPYWTDPDLALLNALGHLNIDPTAPPQDQIQVNSVAAVATGVDPEVLIRIGLDPQHIAALLYLRGSSGPVIPAEGAIPTATAVWRPHPDPRYGSLDEQDIPGYSLSEVKLIKQLNLKGGFFLADEPMDPSQAAEVPYAYESPAGTTSFPFGVSLPLDAIPVPQLESVLTPEGGIDVARALFLGVPESILLQAGITQDYIEQTKKIQAIRPGARQAYLTELSEKSLREAEASFRTAGVSPPTLVEEPGTYRDMEGNLVIVSGSGVGGEPIGQLPDVLPEKWKKSLDKGIAILAEGVVTPFSLWDEERMELQKAFEDKTISKEEYDVELEFLFTSRPWYQQLGITLGLSALPIFPARGIGAGFRPGRGFVPRYVPSVSVARKIINQNIKKFVLDQRGETTVLDSLSGSRLGKELESILSNPPPPSLISTEVNTIIRHMDEVSNAMHSEHLALIKRRIDSASDPLDVRNLRPEEPLAASQARLLESIDKLRALQSLTPIPLVEVNPITGLLRPTLAIQRMGGLELPTIEVPDTPIRVGTAEPLTPYPKTKKLYEKPERPDIRDIPLLETPAIGRPLVDLPDPSVAPGSAPLTPTLDPIIAPIIQPIKSAVEAPEGIPEIDVPLPELEPVPDPTLPEISPIELPEIGPVFPERFPELFPEVTPEPIVEPTIEPIQDPIVTPSPRPGVEPLPEVEPFPEPIPIPEVEPVPTTQPVPITEPLPIESPIPQIEPTTVPEPIQEPFTEPFTQPFVQPVSEPVVQPLPLPEVTRLQEELEETLQQQQQLQQQLEQIRLEPDLVLRQELQQGLLQELQQLQQTQTDLINQLQNLPETALQPFPGTDLKTLPRTTEGTPVTVPKIPRVPPKIPPKIPRILLPPTSDNERRYKEGELDIALVGINTDTDLVYDLVTGDKYFIDDHPSIPDWLPRDRVVTLAYTNKKTPDEILLEYGWTKALLSPDTDSIEYLEPDTRTPKAKGRKRLPIRTLPKGILPGGDITQVDPL